MPSRIVCFVCGSLGGEYHLRSRSCEGCAFFPFLEHHDPPKGSRIPGPDGIVDSCRVCYAFLTQQWEAYERTNTPAIKRLYWLKRLDDGQFTGAEMKLQGEYMAQVMGLQYQPSCGDGCAPQSPDSRDGSGTGLDSDIRTGKKTQSQDEGDRVLDLSVSVKSDASTKSSHKLHPSGDRGLRESTKARSHFDDFCFVCYTCGSENEGIAAKFISSMPHGANEPFFPFLTKLTPPKAAAPMSGHGVCQVCDRCFTSLCHQWLTYEHHGTPNSARIFKVNTQFFSNDSNITVGMGPDSAGTSEVCYLCSNTCSTSKICSLYTAPTKRKVDHMYFPFVRELRRPHGARPLNPDGSVLVCVNCLNNLQEQWQRYETKKVPFVQRRYTLLPPSSLPSASGVTSSTLKPFTDTDFNCDTSLVKNEAVTKSLTQPLAIEISKSPTFVKNHAQSLQSCPPNHSSVATAGGLAGGSVNTTQESSKHHGIDNKTHASTAILSIPHPLQQAGERPKKVCFLCGEKCLLSKAQILYSYPVRHETKNAGGQPQTIPFFPFLASHPPAPGSEPMTEEGTVITCSYCCYSLLNQWRDFEESKGVTDRNRWLRKYTLNEFVCFVCGMMVPRKKMRTLEVQKFLFLREHKAPPNALVMWGGEAVGACGSCHYSLSHQFTEFERLGLPMELRKYNWTVQHHAAEENSCDTHDSIPGVSSATVNEDSNLSVTEGAEDSNHSSPQGTKPLLSLITSGKHQLKSALVLPQNQMSPSNGLTLSGTNTPLSASRTSSFAAALRNLAHQAKDPDDVSDHSLTSPTNHNSRSNTPKRSHVNLVLSSHPATSSFTSPPVVACAPLETAMFQGLGSSDIRESQERSHTGSFDHWNKHDLEHPSLPTDDAVLGGKDLLTRAHARMSVPRSLNSSMPLSSQALNLYARNFHGYRPEEEELLRHGHGLPLSYGIDPTAYAAAAYHPSLLQQQAAFAQGSLRLGDGLLLDQYRMLPSPYLPFPPTGLLSPHSLGIGMHSMLAAAAASQHYAPSLFPQHYSYLGLGQPLVDPQALAQAAMLNRSRLDGDKGRDKKERNHERSAESDINHRAVDVSGEQNIVKKEHHSEGFGKGSFEQRDNSSSHSYEALSRQHSGNHNGVRSSRPGSSISASSGHKHASKISPESVPDKTSQPMLNFNLGGHHGSFKSHSNVSPTRGLTFKPYDKHQQHHDSSHLASQPVLDIHPNHSSVLPPLVNSSSSLEKNKGSSDFTPLFRPFDDSKESTESNFTPVSSHNVHLKQKQWHLNNSSSLPAFHPNELHMKGSVAALSPTQIDPMFTAMRDSNFFDPQNQQKQKASSLNERIERFDFKSLARECMSSSSLNQSGLNSSEVSATSVVGSRQFLSKLDYEAARAKQRRKRGEETDSDNEEEERMKVRLTMVGRATPIPLDTSAPKMDFMEHLGLTTWKRKKELNRKKEIKRRRQLRLSSISPIQHELESMHEHIGDTTSAMSQFGCHVSVSEEMHNCNEQTYEIDPGEKSDFVTRLGLVPASENQKAEIEMRHRYFAEISQMKESSTRSAMQNIKAQDQQKLTDENTLKNIQEKITGLSAQKARFSYGFVDQHNSSGPTGTSWLCDAASKKTISCPEPHVNQPSYQDFLQLPRSYDHQFLPGTSCTTTELGASSTLHLPLTSRRGESLPHQTVYPWPGIGAVLESYHRYREEQLAEAQLLRERCRLLQAENEDLEQVTEKVNRHMAHLMEENQRMVEERNHYQDAINHLKESVRNFR